jgi:hypothetical protein
MGFEPRGILSPVEGFADLFITHSYRVTPSNPESHKTLEGRGLAVTRGIHTVYP